MMEDIEGVVRGLGGVGDAKSGLREGIAGTVCGVLPRRRLCEGDSSRGGATGDP
jgi:hypothetical protein